MGFIRSFDLSQIDRLSAPNAELYARLKKDTIKGDVFPAVRINELHFYYGGGCLYRVEGCSVKRASSNLAAINYEKKYNQNTNGLDSYGRAKKQNENRYENKKGSSTERQLLAQLYKNTFLPNRETKIVVLDIEVNLNGKIGGAKKCDMVLLNNEKCQIMFVEGKVFNDKRVNVKVGFTPEVIEQVRIYTEAIKAQEKCIEEQYARHISIINALFNTEYCPKVTLIPKAKLLVYRTPKEPRDNGRYSIKEINNALGEESVYWVKEGSDPTLENIWEALCK